MKEMRKTLFVCMNEDAATYAARIHPVWQIEIQQALLEKLTELTTAEGMTFQQLCQLPERWAIECQNWHFVSFADLIRYVPDRKCLEEAASIGVRNVILHSHLIDFRQTPLPSDDGWYSMLLRFLIAEHVSKDVSILAQECENPQQFENLLQVLQDTQASITPETEEALKLILHGNGRKDVMDTLKQLRCLGDAMPLAIGMLRKAVFGPQSRVWSNWNTNNCSDRIPMAAICYLADQNKDWSSFLSVVLEDSSMEKSALSEGKDPVQALMFASSVLHDMGMDAEANEMPDQLKNCRREEYAHVRALGRKRRELAALKKADCWAATGAAASLHQLIFNK